MFLYIQCLIFVVTSKCYLKLNPQCGHDCMQVTHDLRAITVDDFLRLGDLKVHINKGPIINGYGAMGIF